MGAQRLEHQVRGLNLLADEQLQVLVRSILLDFGCQYLRLDIFLRKYQLLRHSLPNHVATQ